jgi:uncharacterized damage-inducible protein DinB
MSVFTNTASRSIEAAQAYVSALLELLGERDPLEVLRATDPALRERVADLTNANTGRPEAPGKWSIRQVIQHLADSDLVWGWRVRLVLAQDRPPLTGYDQDAWAGRLRYQDARVTEALDEFSMLRRSNLRLIERASPEDLARVGLHAERGEESITRMIQLYAGHDLLHLRQIDRIRTALGI